MKVERRDATQLDQRVRQANVEHQQILEDFEFHFNPQAPKGTVLDLATCAFVKRRESALLLGPTGVGKSHIAHAPRHRACRAGFSVLYTSAQDVPR